MQREILVFESPLAEEFWIPLNFYYSLAKSSGIFDPSVHYREMLN